ncbi:MAG: hypothetical protein AMXMBFR7_07170 [Planctomycetota bacterium]
MKTDASERPSELDPAALAQLESAGGGAFVRTMLGMFLELTPERLAQLNAAWRSGNREEAERHAHSLKTGAAMLGAPELRALAEAAERHAAEGRMSEAAALGPKMNAVFQALEPVIKERMAQYPKE